MNLKSKYSRKILVKHPLWNRLREQLKKVANYPLKEVDEEELEKDVAELLAFGNHKGVTKNDKLFKNMM